MGHGYAALAEGLQDHGRDEESELIRCELQSHHLLQPGLLLSDAGRVARLQQILVARHRLRSNKTCHAQGVGCLTLQLEHGES